MAVKKKPAQKTDTEKPGASLRFEDLELSDLTLEALRVAGYAEPTVVQAGMITKAIEGIDLVGQAHTGTGKTAAFAIPIIEVLETHHGKSPRALVLVPTRELAVQVHGEVTKLSHGRRLNCVAVYGGKPIRSQIEKLRRGADVIVGTPGRVMDHMSRRTLDLSDLEIVVLDEADRMLDIGFRPDIEKILRQCPSDRQTLLLSATVPPPIERLAQRYMHEPEILNFSSSDISVETIEQSYFTVDHGRKFELLVRLLAREKPQQAIVFCRTKRRTESLFRRLSTKHVDSVACIHGDMAQGNRDRVMERFRAGKIRCLIATDVVGRGIDVTSISHIINFDTPQFCDDYVHRVGRTGRMGREGVAFTFVAPEEGPELTRIEQRINRQLKRGELSGFDTTQDEFRAASLADLSDDTQPATATTLPPPAPPFGRHSRRHRRAL
ncbi:MAG: DEAD/DEAH box helicase [Pirellulaceae bacterium]